MSSKRYTEEFRVAAVGQVTERRHSVADCSQALTAKAAPRTARKFVILAILGLFQAAAGSLVTSRILSNLVERPQAAVS